VLGSNLFLHYFFHPHPNGSCKAILDIYTLRTFQRYKEHLNAKCFDPYNRALNFRESRRTPKSHFRECEWQPHTSLKVGLRQVPQGNICFETFCNHSCFYIGLRPIIEKVLKIATTLYLEATHLFLGATYTHFSPGANHMLGGANVFKTLCEHNFFL
jgi:hypothetical protein